MTRQAHDNGTQRIDAAFDRVLAAQARAREQVARCREEAAGLIARARERARAIAARADLRVRRAHGIADAQVARALGAIAAEGEAQGACAAEQVPPQGLDLAIARLADEILGLSPEPSA